MRQNLYSQRGYFTVSFIRINIFHLKNIFPGRKISIRNFFPSVGHKPIRLIRTKPVTILLLAFRIRKVIERQRKVTIRMIQPDKRRIENTLWKNGLPIDLSSYLYRFIIYLQSGNHDRFGNGKRFNVIGVKISKIFIISPKQDILPMQDRTVTARNVIIIKQMLMTAITGNTWIRAQPDLPVRILSHATNKVTAQSIPGSIYMSYRILSGRENCQTGHVSDIQITIGRS